MIFFGFAGARVFKLSEPHVGEGTRILVLWYSVAIDCMTLGKPASAGGAGWVRTRPYMRDTCTLRCTETEFRKPRRG